jgi:hypothetical protein
MVARPKAKPNWILKGCPTCIKGDLFREDGHYTCLQCGFIKYDKKPLPLLYRKFDPVMLERRGITK